MTQWNLMKPLGLAALGMVLWVGAANAWYGDPWYRPYGSGAVTYERQSMMRGHGYVMAELGHMFDGRRAFNRDEAVRLARELEQGFGDDLIKNFPPGTVVAGSRTAPYTWRNFGLFRGYAEAARQSSARLAKALENAPGGQEPAPREFGVPPRGMGYGRWGRPLGTGIPMDAVREYSQLNATCHTCHAAFRGPRR